MIVCAGNAASQAARATTLAACTVRPVRQLLPQWRMNAKRTLRVLGVVVLGTFAGCTAQPRQGATIAESSAAYSSSLYPAAFITMTSLEGAEGPYEGPYLAAGQYCVPPGKAATATLTWKNPYLTPGYDFVGTVTCLQVSVDHGKWGLVDCENTGKNVYTTTVDWITAGHFILFSLVNYNWPRGHTPPGAWQRDGLVMLPIDTRCTSTVPLHGSTMPSAN